MVVITLLKENDAPPEVTLESNITSGRIPFSPSFLYNCFAPKNDLALCELKSDGKIIFSAIEKPESIESPVYMEPGIHLLEITATDKRGKTSSKNLTFYVNNTIEVFVNDFPPEFNATYIEAVRDAFTYWEKRNNVIFKEVNEISGPDTVFVDWIKEYGGPHIGQATRGNSINIGLGDNHCNNKYQLFTYYSVVAITKHEVGHILGYQHSNDSNDIMYPITYTKYVNDINETEVIPEGYYKSYPLCTSRDSAEYLFDITSDKLIDFYVFPSESEVDNFVNNLDFKFAGNCVKKNSNTFNQLCTVSNSSRLLIYDPSAEPGAYTVDITIKEI